MPWVLNMLKKQRMTAMAIQLYLPEFTASVTELAATAREIGMEFSVERERRLQDEYGFKKVPLEAEGMRLTDMISKVCTPLLRWAMATGRRVDRILLVRTLDSYWQDEHPLREVRIQGAVGVPIHSLSQHNCASVHVGLMTAEALLSSGTADGIMMITTDKAYHPSLRQLPHSLLGDAAAAAYLSNSPGEHELLAINCRVNPSIYAGYRSPVHELAWEETTYLFRIRQLIRDTLRSAGMSIRELRMIIGNNVNRSTWRHLASMMGEEEELWYTDTIAQFGHLHCSDIWFNIQHAIQAGRLREGDYYLTVSVGLGSLGCSIHQYSGSRTG